MKLKLSRDDLAFRLHNRADTKLIVAMINKDQHHMLHGYTAEKFEQDLDEPSERIRENTFIVELANKMVGYFSLCFVERETHISVYCYATVDMDWRRRGIGSAMFAYIFDHLQHAAQQGNKPIHFIHRALTSIPGETALGVNLDMEVQNCLQIMCLDDWSRAIQDIQPNGFRFRSPQLEDASSWAEIYNDAFGGNKTAVSVIHEFQGVEFSPELYLMGVDEKGTPVGLICATNRGNHARIPTLAVKREWQRHGVGRALLSEMLRGLRAAGALDVRLSVESRNEAAQALYTQCGFEPEYQRIHYSTIFSKI
ncbi:acetyltransferase (GNAT) family protein [Paenibacillus cellulosilyticus]|uniref:Acetyltransferase (GNAT) family protein n=1 Tax=Paenibacillus cellulosilyticus TaxID=375489 RepID=A0A2V2YUJ3_9BACL|nr:GNAT family N-acetyltransferase [Paenibacillus cellulosilyticus]PWW02937.1 acetyltransferase (GNAT) family protein [Paenibacillus cellulosilyticus]QKS45844.1 GNAT family N-acetyltransferase [Paenibacillus cellulosilyticus]